MNVNTAVERAVRSQASRVRYVLLTFVCLLAIISYVHRVCISASGPHLAAELGLSAVQMGFVYGAFILAYGAFSVPGGLLGDKIGGRKAITILVVTFSLFTALTGVVHSLFALVAVRFAFGAGEAGVFPNVSKIISKWMPHSKWGFAQGLMWMFGRLGGAFAPPLVVALGPVLGWRGSFWFFAAIGLIWAGGFWWWFRDTPEQKCGVNEAELQLIRESDATVRSHHALVRMPWSRAMRSGNLMAICGMYFCFSYGWHFYMTWFPTYMKARGFSAIQSGIFGGLPFLFGAVGCVLGGLLTDYLFKKTGDLRSRRYIGSVGFLLMAICMITVAKLENPRAAVLTISLASFFGDLTLSSCWAVCMDVGKEFAGTVTGLMSTCGNIGGFLFPIVTGFLIQHSGNWKLPIVVAGAIFFLGSLIWLRIDPREAIVS
jgi:MFS transporter, ACS family, glucarate transporter